MKYTVRWLSVAFIEVITEYGKVVLFDPWTKSNGNSLCPYSNEDFQNADLILVSHDHQDHVGSAVSIVNKSKAFLGGPDETMKRLYAEEGLNQERVVNDGAGYIVGGGTDLGWVKVVAVPALHTSRTSVPNGTITIFDRGPTVYHAGDTAITAEMEIFARLYPIDLAILPIMGIAMMDYIQATEAVRLMKPKRVMPIHFDFCKNPEETLRRFVKHCREVNPEVEVIETQMESLYQF
jgi:L-ascorbate metabolism protein UlaG (beta-lactamase superfamily)